MRRIQAKLMPEHELDIVAINMLTGDYTIGKTMKEVMDQFNAQWPGYPSYVCRVDGGPAVRI